MSPQSTMPAPLKVAIVTYVVDHNDGQGRVNHEIVAAALAAGCEVTLVANRVAEVWRKHPRVHWQCVPEVRLPAALLRDQVFAIASGWWLARNRHRFDIVHVNGFITWARADVNTAHFVHHGWLHSGYYPYRLRDGWRAAYRWLYTHVNVPLERRAFRQARVVVALTPRIVAELHATGVPADGIEVIPNGVDTSEFAPGKVCRERFGLPAGVPLLLFAGDLRTSRKNLDTVLAALADVPEPVALAVAGTTEGSVYPQLARDLGVAERVHFIGHVADMPALMRSCDALVFPSRYEAMSLVVLEAMASGIAVLAARSTGAAGFVPPDAGVVLDDPNDASALAAAIRQLTADPAALRRMGQAGRAAMLGQGWGAMGERYLQLYRRLARRPAAARVPATDMTLEGESR
ncbi:glycosyltransferase family 4 protein [Sorangium sp. So ce448]